MKKQLLKTIILFLSSMLGTSVFAQNVQLCITVNGSPLPSNRQAYICKANNVTNTSLSTTQLIATNCATSPELNVTITWKNLDVAPYTDSTDNAITAASVGRWEAKIVNNTTSAVTKDTVFLSLYPAIGVVVNDGLYNPNAPGGAPAGCPLNTFNLTSTPSGPVTSYKWYNYAPKVIIPGATASSLNINKRNSYYIVEAIDANGCVASDTSTSYFTQLPTLAVNVGPDPTVFCEGGTFSLVSSVPVGFVVTDHTTIWGFKQGATNTNLGSVVTSGQAPAPAVNVTPPGGVSRYWIRVSKFPYCDNSDTVVITTKPIPVVNIGPASKLVCYGEDSIITSNITVGTAPFVYTWTSVPASTLPSTASITVSPTVNTTYTLSVTDVNNCGAGTDNILLNVNPQINIAISNDTSICKFPAGTAQLNATPSGGAGGFTHKWLPTSGLSSSTISNPVATPNSSTVYTYTAKDPNNCKASKLVTVTKFAPDLAPVADPIVISETVSATLTVSTATNAGYSFSWYTDVAPTPILSNTSSLYLEYQGPDTNNYVVSVHGAGLSPSVLNTCYNYDTIIVRSISENTLLYVPNVFSPEAINPENQKFRIYGDNLLSDGFKLVVYNKWGNLMFETTNLEVAKVDGWDGGAKIEGVYTYVITGKFKNGKDVSESKYNKGTFSLIR